MSNKNKKQNFTSQIYFKIDAKQVTLIPGQVVYVPEPKSETNTKMKSEKWSTPIAKSRHYMFICSDGRFATLLPISSEPPKNPFQIQYKDKLRSGLDLTIRCDQKCKIPLARLVEGKYSNFKGIAYTFDKETTMKLIGYSMMYELYQWYDLEESQAMLHMAWEDKEAMLNSFKGEFNNMDYDFRHGPHAAYDDIDETMMEEVPDTETEKTETKTDSNDKMLETVSMLQKKIEELTAEIKDIRADKQTADAGDIIEAVTSKSTLKEYSNTPDEKSEVMVVEEAITDNYQPQIESTTDNITGGNEISGLPEINDDVADAIHQRQTAINTYSLMDNIKTIRKARGLKVDPVDNETTVNAKETSESANYEMIEKGSSLNAEFGSIDSIKFTRLAPISAKGNSLRAFVETECVKRTTEFTSLRVLYAAYRNYCQSTGLWCASLGDLKCYLVLNGYKVDRLMIDQKDRPMDAVNIVLKAQLKLIEKTKSDIGINDAESSKESITDEVKTSAPDIPRKNDRVIWNSELVEYASGLVKEDPDKAVELFHYKNLKSLKAVLSKYQKVFATVTE